MTHARITVNRKVELDADVDDWEQRPPAMFADAIKPGAKPQPWLQPIAVILANSVRASQSVKMNVTTAMRGYTIKVEYS